MTKYTDSSTDIQTIHRELGIPDSYAETCMLDYHPDCENLVATELDVFGRQPQLEQQTFTAWQKMQENAGQDGVILQIVSAYRSAQYQKELLQRKLEQGQSIEEILKINAAPGYSEHHSGCAVDLTTPDFEPLAEAFENSQAFAWLSQHAENFGFSMSFPKNNPTGILYEPWHWKYSHEK